MFTKLTSKIVGFYVHKMSDYCLLFRAVAVCLDFEAVSVINNWMTVSLENLERGNYERCSLMLRHRMVVTVIMRALSVSVCVLIKA